MTVKKLNRFVLACKKDDKMRTFRRMMKKGTYASIDCMALSNEIMQMHSIRKVRRLNKSNVITNAQEELVEAHIQNQAYRSRSVEIKMVLHKNIAIMEEHVEALQRYLKTRYHDLLKDDYRTVGDRDSAVEQRFEKANKLLAGLYQVREIADMLINDLDQAAWTLKGIVETFNLSVQRERDL